MFDDLYEWLEGGCRIHLGSTVAPDALIVLMETRPFIGISNPEEYTRIIRN